MISESEYDRLSDIVLDELYRLGDYLSPQQAKDAAAAIMQRVIDGGMLDADRIEMLQGRIAELEALNVATNAIDR
jgi:hypothetical protein